MGWIVWSVSAIFVRVFKENISASFDGERNVIHFFYPILCISVVYMLLRKLPTIYYNNVGFGILSAVRKISIIHIDQQNIQSKARYPLVSDCLFPAAAPVVVNCLFEPVIWFSMFLMVTGGWVCCHNSLSTRFYLPLPSGEETTNSKTCTQCWCWLAVCSRFGEIMFFSCSVLNSSSSLLDTVTTKYFFSTVAVCTYNMIHDGTLTGRFSLLEAEYSMLNYILFSHKFVLNIGEIILLCQAIALAPNPGYITLASSFYLPMLHLCRHQLVDNYQIETLCISFYLQTIGLFFLFMLGRHVDDQHNVTSVAFVTN